VLYVVCSFTTVMESPSFGTPTPTNGAPPLDPGPDWLAIPLADPSVLVIPDPEPGPDAPSVAGPLAAPLVAVPPPSVGALELPSPPGEDDPNPPDPEDEYPGDDDPNPEPEPA
jgi:hypothetical protein